MNRRFESGNTTRFSIVSPRRVLKSRSFLNPWRVLRELCTVSLAKNAGRDLSPFHLLEGCKLEHFKLNPKVRGSIPRVSQIYRVQRIIDFIDYQPWQTVLLRKNTIKPHLTQNLVSLRISATLFLKYLKYKKLNVSRKKSLKYPNFCGSRPPRFS